MVIKTGHLPKPGETILGGSFFMNGGGKGANQAVAAARLGGAVTFICKTGNDIFGKQSIDLFEKENINTKYILTDAAKPSGVALITVDKNGENCITVAPGANAALMPEHLQSAADTIATASVILIQLEIPLQTVFWVAETAAKYNVKLILNPAPAQHLPESLMKNIFIITPNETEAGMLSGITVKDIQSAKEAANIIKQKGINTVIITMGATGALVVTDTITELVTAPHVDAADTTAAGDVFNGALAVAIAEGAGIIEAAKFAGNAAAISVTRMGAQASAPYRHELALFNK